MLHRAPVVALSVGVGRRERTGTSRDGADSAARPAPPERSPSPTRRRRPSGCRGRRAWGCSSGLSARARSAAARKAAATPSGRTGPMPERCTRRRSTGASDGRAPRGVQGAPEGIRPDVELVSRIHARRPATAWPTASASRGASRTAFSSASRTAACSSAVLRYPKPKLRSTASYGLSSLGRLPPEQFAHGVRQDPVWIADGRDDTGDQLVLELEDTIRGWKGRP